MEWITKLQGSILGPILYVSDLEEGTFSKLLYKTRQRDSQYKEGMK